jgi:hypothetical protein
LVNVGFHSIVLASRPPRFIRSPRRRG